jgi:hypothetical protein
MNKYRFEDILSGKLHYEQQSRPHIDLNIDQVVLRISLPSRVGITTKAIRQETQYSRVGGTGDTLNLPLHDHRNTSLVALLCKIDASF